MRVPSSQPPGDPADAAIDRVLAAEVRAREAIIGCRRQALAILREARARARRLANRGEVRVGRVQAMCDARLERLRAASATRRAALEGRPELTPELNARLDAALERLLQELLGDP